MTGIEISVEKDTENALLERRDVLFSVTAAGATPKAEDVKAGLAKKLGVPAEHILLDHVYQERGSHVSKCIAKVYNKPVAIKAKEKKDEESKKS